jgi:predicted nucleic acid-binding protein
MSFVLDSSITMSWLLQDESDQYAARARDLLDQQTAHVPMIWLSEVVNVLRQSARRNRISGEYEVWSLNFLAQLPIAIDSSDPWVSARRIQALAVRHNLTAYDADYLELALRLQVPLATLDKELARAAQSENTLLTIDR